MGRTIGRADMNGSDYKDASELQVVTLENAIYLSMKNDVAYVLHDELFLYEQQSTKMQICRYAVCFMQVTRIRYW